MKKLAKAGGYITRSVDEFDNTTDYQYNNGRISQIEYSDGSSVVFEKVTDNILQLMYINDRLETAIAQFVYDVDSSGTQKLITITDNTGEIHFDYDAQENFLLLKSYSLSNKYKKTITYEKLTKKSLSNIPHIITLDTVYNDDSTENKQYFYNNQGKLERLIDGNVAEISYSYSQERDGSRTVSESKKYNGEVSLSAETINKMGQTTKYVSNGTVLELKYNQFDKVSKEIENNKNIDYSYTDKGQVSKKYSSNGELTKYVYYEDGSIKKIATNNGEINYTQSGEIVGQKTELEKNAKLITGNSKVLAAATGVNVSYNINSSVGVTNFVSYYGLTQSKFNCYTFSIAKYTEIRNPGYYSGRALPLSSLAGIKLNVEKDQKSLGRGIYDSTVSASIPGHSWKIALKIRANSDYHFMGISNSSGSAWQFKAGQTGPVMRLLSGKTPSSVTWDMYRPSNSKYVVYTSNYYNSSINYMIIRD